MQRIILFLCVLLLSFNGFSQRKKRFKKGAKIRTAIVHKEGAISGNSILFSYHGTTHYIYFYLDLTEKLKNVFQDSGKKMGFNYDLHDKDHLPLWDDLKSMPKEKEALNEYDLFCKINFVFFKPSKNYWSKINFDIVLEIYDIKTSALLKTTTIQVKCYKTIITQNEKVSRLIYEALML